MDGALREQLNQFLVERFNNILRLEEQVLTASNDGKLSVSEYHVLEAVVGASQLGQNTMREVAERLAVTAGTLTTAVKVLETKGYLLRQRGERDKRVVWIIPTAQALEANALHAEFHKQMVNGVIDCMDSHQLLALVEALAVLGDWFDRIKAEPGYISVEQTFEQPDELSDGQSELLLEEP